MSLSILEAYRCNRLTVTFLKEARGQRKWLISLKCILRASLFEICLNQGHSNVLQGVVGLYHSNYGRDDLAKDIKWLSKYIDTPIIDTGMKTFRLSFLFFQFFKFQRPKVLGLKLPWHVWILCTATQIEYQKLLRHLDSLWLPGVGVFSNELQYTQRLVAMGFRAKQIKTVGLQHGFYRDTGRKISTSNSNPINYLNLICDVHVCWGLHAQRIVQKYHKGEIWTFGKATSSFELLEPTRPQAEADAYIILDSIQQKAKNLQLIASVRNFTQRRILVLKHPDDDSQYEMDLEVVSCLEGASKNDQFFGRNSSLILQLGHLGGQIFLSTDSDFLQMMPNTHIRTPDINPRVLKISNAAWIDFIQTGGERYGEKLMDAINDIR